MLLDKEKIEIINKFLIENISPYLIIVFGSFAKGTVREDSDIDIAFLSDKEIDNYELFMIAQGLSELLGKQVDLINLRTSSTVFNAQVVGNGKVLYCSDVNRKNYFQMYVLKDYALLNEERKDILENIKKRGKIYG